MVKEADRHFAAGKPVPDSPPDSRGGLLLSRVEGAHLSVPIRLRDGEIYGTFCCFSSRPDPSLTNRDLATMEAFAQIAGEQIQQAIDSDEDRQTKLRRISSILDTRDLEIVYQPAIRLDEPGIDLLRPSRASVQTRMSRLIGGSPPQPRSVSGLNLRCWR